MLTEKELNALRHDLLKRLEQAEEEGKRKVIAAIERLSYPTIDRVWLVGFLRAPGVVK